MPTFKRVNKIEGKATAYGVKEIATGETVELDGHLAEKAKRNPNYEEVKNGDKGGSQRQSSGRPGKAGNRTKRQQ